MKRRLKRTWGEDLTRRNKKTNSDPGAHHAKIAIRRNVLEAIGAAEARVFDAFAGEGLMHQAVWHEAADYVGCDQTWYRDERVAFVADNRRVMRSVDLRDFNIFDFDSWGSPWEQCLILAARRGVAAGERIGVVLTEGAGFRINLGTIPDALAIMARLSIHAAGGSRSLDEISYRAIFEFCRRLNVKLTHHWRAKGRSSARMIYVGLVLQGREERS